MDSVWEDIGYSKVKERVNPKYPPAPELKPKDWDKIYVPKEAKNLEFIAGLGLDMEMNGGKVSIQVGGRKVDFWPRSGTWFSHSKGKYGTDIESICQKMRAFIT